MQTVDFTSKGIRIVALDERQLGLLLEDQALLFAELGLPAQVFEDTDMLIKVSTSHCLREMKKAGPDWPYSAIWLGIETETGLIVADFMLKTGLDSTGAVEIGYGVHGQNEGRGVMTRTVACLLDWARNHSKIKRIKAETLRSNIASMRVLEKNGFREFVPLDESVWWERRV